MNPYRIKHIKSGLYYQPTKSGNNLSKTGKVYIMSVNCLSGDTAYVYISIKKSSRVASLLNLDEFKECGWASNILFCKVPKSEFIKEEL